MKRRSWKKREVNFFFFFGFFVCDCMCGQLRACSAPSLEGCDDPPPLFAQPARFRRTKFASSVYEVSPSQPRQMESVSPAHDPGTLYVPGTHGLHVSHLVSLVGVGAAIWNLDPVTQEVTAAQSCVCFGRRRCCCRVVNEMARQGRRYNKLSRVQVHVVRYGEEN